MVISYIPIYDLFYILRHHKKNNIRKPTKHVLLASTALALSAGVAAADFSTSATAKRTYGNFGTGNFRAGYANPLNGTAAATATTAAIPGVEYTAATAAAAADTVFSAADKAAGDKARTAAEKSVKQPAAQQQQKPLRKMLLI